MTKLKHRFRVRRPASCRLESVESVAFRRALYAENALEAFYLRMLDTLDFDALSEISYFVGTIVCAGERLIVVEPKGEWSDHSLLDAALCQAGLRRFVRPVLPSDRLPVELRDADHVAVQELAKGVRVRRPITVIWNEEGSRHERN